MRIPKHKQKQKRARQILIRSDCLCVVKAIEDEIL